MMNFLLGRPRRWAAASLVLVLAGSGWSAVTSVLEHEVKAAFIYNFIRFVEWPETAPGVPIRVEVAGPQRVVKSVREALDGRAVGERPISVRRVERPEDAADADVLYVAGNDVEMARRFVEAVGDRPVLTVTECRDFLSVGSLVHFYLADQSVRFAVNADRLEQSRLKLSSQMLQFAAIVRRENR